LPCQVDHFEPQIFPQSQSHNPFGLHAFGAEPEYVKNGFESFEE